MNETWFTSDTHFGHGYVTTQRGFAIPEDHDEHVISEWNRRVGKNDDVFHLGDVSFYNKEYTAKILKRLNGNIFLIRGNHDKNIKGELLHYFGWVKDLYEIRTKRFGTPIVLCHYCMRIWNRSHYGALHFHGHSHGSLAPDPNSRAIDVGLDCWDLQPITFEVLQSVLNKRDYKPIDHHE